MSDQKKDQPSPQPRGPQESRLQAPASPPPPPRAAAEHKADHPAVKATPAPGARLTTSDSPPQPRVADIERQIAECEARLEEVEARANEPSLSPAESHALHTEASDLTKRVRQLKEARDYAQA